MSLNLNQVTIAGSLTRDVQTKQIGNSTVAEFGIAINRKYKGNDGELKEETTFVDISVWGKQGETCAKYLSKGRNCLIEGALAFSAWTDKEGKKRSKLTVNAQRVHFIGGNQDTKAPAQEHQDVATGYSVSNSMGGSDSEEGFTPF